MEAYFTQHCVTTASGPEKQGGQDGARSECVLLQENRQARGASRAVLAAVLQLVLRAPKTSTVLLFTLDSPLLVERLEPSAKLTHKDYSADTSLFQASLDVDAAGSNTLLPKLLEDVKQVETSVSSAQKDATRSTRPVVVVIDSLNVLLQQHSLSEVLLFLREVRARALVGSVIMRLNAGAERAETAQTLAMQATAVALVETRTSLRAYPLLAMERRRELPKGQHGLVLLVRHKKNGRSSESVECFQAQGDRLVFSPFTPNASQTPPRVDASPAPGKTRMNCATPRETPSSAPARVKPAGLRSVGQNVLPVRQEDVSFNLHISEDEQRAKDQVQLPYMHQAGATDGSSSSATAGGSQTNTLFFIDEDDPDWDDDDVDDDLDI